MKSARNTLSQSNFFLPTGTRKKNQKKVAINNCSFHNSPLRMRNVRNTHLRSRLKIAQFFVFEVLKFKIFLVHFPVFCRFPFLDERPAVLSVELFSLISQSLSLRSLISQLSLAHFALKISPSSLVCYNELSFFSVFPTQSFLKVFHIVIT